MSEWTWATTCQHCNKAIGGTGGYPEQLEELRDEGWYQVAGLWYCNECSPSPATQAYIEELEARLRAMAASTAALAERTQHQVVYGPIKEEVTWQRGPLPAHVDPELVRRIVEEEKASIGRHLTSLGWFRTKPQPMSQEPPPPSAAPSTQGDTPSG